MSLSAVPMPPSGGLLLAGEWVRGADIQTVTRPWDSSPIAEAGYASAAQLEAARNALPAAQRHTARLSLYQRHAVLTGVAQRLHTHTEAIAQLICAEAGKPITLARTEVSRAQLVFELAAETLRTEPEEMLRLDILPGLEGRKGLVQRVAAGPVLAISPFNFPLNLVAHKLAPAIMAGNAFLLKPASSTPLSALVLGRLILEAGYTPQAVNILPHSSRYSSVLVGHPIFSILSFTGSPAVGWQLKQQAGRAKVCLELGGDAAGIVMPDADIEAAARQLAFGAYAYAGQICISVQRMLVHSSIAQPFTEAFVHESQQLGVGDPGLDSTICGPVIDQANFERVQHWADEALSAGAQSLLPTLADPAHRLHAPILLKDVPANCRLARDEAFAPIALLHTFDTLDEAIARTNASRFGLQAGLFTQRQDVIKRCWDELEVGAVVVNQAPTLRIDPMPYGGVKDSGLGREGLRYAWHEMTEARTLVW